MFPVFLLAWLRFGIAALAMPHWLRGEPAEAPLSRHDRVLLFLESFLGNFLFSICMLFGVAATSALAAGVVMAAIPAAVALLARIFLGERIRPRVMLAIGCAAAGIALLAWARGGAGAHAAAPWWGYALLLGAVFCEASYVVIGKRLTGGVSARRISAIINLWGFALVTPFGIWQALRFDFAAVAPSLWLLLVFYALAASIWSVWLWMRGFEPCARAAGRRVHRDAARQFGVGRRAAARRSVRREPCRRARACAGRRLLATWPERARPRAASATAWPGRRS